MKRLIGLFFVLVLFAAPTLASAKFTTVGSFASLPAAATSNASDTAYGILEDDWRVFDGANWIPCTGGRCALATKDVCDQDYVTNVAITLSGATLRTELVSETAGMLILICGVDWGSAGTSTVQLVNGTTNTNACDTGTQNVTGAYSEIAQTGRVLNKEGRLKTGTVGHKLCAVRGANVAVDGSLQFRKYFP